MRDYVMRWETFVGKEMKEVIPESEFCEEQILHFAKLESDLQFGTVMVFRRTDGKMDGFIRAFKHGEDVTNKPLNEIPNDIAPMSLKSFEILHGLVSLN